MCTPSRSDQIATNAATSHCLAFGAEPATGHSALAAPTSPSENVQMVSTQPELPVRCCTIHAAAIRTDRDTAIAARASRYKASGYQTTIRNPANSLTRQTFSKYVQAQAGFHVEVPHSDPKRAATGLFSRLRCAILVSETVPLATGDTSSRWLQAPPPPPRWRSN